MSFVGFQPATLLSIHRGSSGVRNFKVFPLYKKNMLIGRDEKCDISLNSDQILDHHAQLFFESKVWKIRNLNYREDIVVNQAIVPTDTAVKLSSRTVLKLANLELVFHDGPLHNKHFLQSMLENSFQIFPLKRCCVCEKHLVTSSVPNCGHDFCALCIAKLQKTKARRCTECPFKVISFQFIPLHGRNNPSTFEAASSDCVSIQKSIDETADSLALRIDSNLTYNQTLVNSTQFILPDQTLIKLYAKLEQTQRSYWNSNALSLLINLESGCDCEPRYVDIDVEVYYLGQWEIYEQRCASENVRKFELTSKGNDISIDIGLRGTNFMANLKLWPPANDRLVITVKIRKSKTEYQVSNLTHLTRLFEQITVSPSSAMNNAPSDPYAADSKVIAKDNEYFVHRQVLAEKSPVFRQMFTHKMVENETGVIDISTYVDNETVYELLRYFYTDKVIWQEKQVIKLLGFAHMYQMASLLSSCEHYLGSNLDIESVSPTISIAAFYSLNCLKTRCIEFIKRNDNAVFSSNNWKQLASQAPELVEDVRMSMPEYLEHHIKRMRME